MFHWQDEVPKDAATRNCEAVIAIVAQLVARLAAYGGLQALRIPRAAHSAILRILRPAESAFRRLIVIAARGLKVEDVAARPTRKGGPEPKRRNGRMPSATFRLFDPKTHPPREIRVVYRTKPFRISFIEPPPPFAPVFARPDPPAPLPIGPPASEISALNLCRRLKALTAALDDLPGQARRLARWQARQENHQTPAIRSPLRPGRPPGFRKVPVFAVDFILAECHAQAREVLARAVTTPAAADTS